MGLYSVIGMFCLGVAIGSFAMFLVYRKGALDTQERMKPLIGSALHESVSAVAVSVDGLSIMAHELIKFSTGIKGILTKWEQRRQELRSGDRFEENKQCAADIDRFLTEEMKLEIGEKSITKK